jgi:hypothetical protein
MLSADASMIHDTTSILAEAVCSRARFRRSAAPKTRPNSRKSPAPAKASPTIDLKIPQGGLTVFISASIAVCRLYWDIE